MKLISKCVLLAVFSIITIWFGVKLLSTENEDFTVYDSTDPEPGQTLYDSPHAQVDEKNENVWPVGNADPDKNVNQQIIKALNEQKLRKLIFEEQAKKAPIPRKQDQLVDSKVIPDDALDGDTVPLEPKEEESLGPVERAKKKKITGQDLEEKLQKVAFRNKGDGVKILKPPILVRPPTVRQLPEAEDQLKNDSIFQNFTSDNAVTPIAIDEAKVANEELPLVERSQNLDLDPRRNTDDQKIEDQQTTIIYKEESELLKDRIVHLDLKGAAPRVEYLKRIFPFFRALGATGLLIEWEDTFPYHGDLQAARNAEGYNDEDVQEILKAAKESNLKIIPLIQTFGHMEWILKHPQYANLREVRKYPQVVCPSNEVSFALVKMIIDDVIRAHNGFIDAVHIGSDEVYQVGKQCDRCAKAVEELGSVDRLILQHVKTVAQYVKDTYDLRVLTWHDMFKNSSVDILRASNIGELIEPVIWGYKPDLIGDNYFPDGLFDRFGAIFPSVWIASAFKGANGADQTFVDVLHYADNHISWLSLLHDRKNLLQGVNGAILTGWQRYDHFAVLCELLPVSIPSLAVNLQIFQTGTDNGVLEEAQKMLYCDTGSDWIEAAPEWSRLIEVFELTDEIKTPTAPFLNSLLCEFPGSDVYALVERLRIVRHYYDVFINMDATKGWMSEYNMKHQYGSVFRAEQVYNRSQIFAENFADLGKLLRQEMGKIYFDDTVDEWLYENVQIYVEKLKSILMAAEQIMQKETFGNRPLAPTQDEV